MPTCETCGNDYDKAFQVLMNGRRTRTTALSAQFMPWRRRASIAERASRTRLGNERHLLLRPLRPKGRRDRPPRSCCRNSGDKRGRLS